MVVTLSKVLIANRGEIALRIIATCRKLGMSTVAVYSDADKDSAHTRAADTAVRIGGPSAADSYLAMDALVDAAIATGCDCVHPGYGFLSERAAFAAAVEDAGLVWIGPSPASIKVMGSKMAAKTALAAAANVPLIPGYSGEAQELAVLVDAAAEIGVPLLVKASAGGGGKGMRVVRDLADVAAAVESAKAEAAASFGDDAVLLERYFESVRHIEFQVFGDSHGNVVHMFERECSVQRRHQKVVEEAPSPAVSPRLRAAMGAHAIAIAKAVDYVGAGTVEFIVDAVSGDYFFLEMNTRLQVEHPVTEAVTGLDLVELQFFVAEGGDLTQLAPDHPWIVGQATATECAPPPLGAAIETRVYAEDPAAGFMPCTGTVTLFSPPTTPADVRVDACLQSGSEISVFYDAMVAKITVSGPDRSAAIRKMLAALADTAVQGVTTNIGFLSLVVGHPAFAAGDTLTSFIETHLPAEACAAARAAALDASKPTLAVVAVLRAWLDRGRARRSPHASQPRVLAHIPTGWSNTNSRRGQTVRVGFGDDGLCAAAPVSYRVVLARGASAPPCLVPRAFEVTLPAEFCGGAVGDDPLVVDAELVDQDASGRILVRIGAFAAWYHCSTGTELARELGTELAVSSPGLDPLVSGVRVALFSRFAGSAGVGASASSGAVDPAAQLAPTAPMPAKVVAVEVSEGDTVLAGDTLVVLESMKMQTRVICGPEAATVATVSVQPGELVAKNAPLVSLTPLL